jgi:hypothetical protein
VAKDRFGRRLSETEIKKLAIEDVELVVRNAPDQALLDLAQFSLFGPAQPKDVIQVDGFDASGIKGLRWQFIDDAGTKLAEGECAGTLLALKEIASQATGPGWLTIAIADRAGNATEPVWIPVRMPGSGTP